MLKSDCDPLMMVSDIFDCEAILLMPVQDMLSGDCAGSVLDPFGHTLFLATHNKDLTPQEIRKAAEVAYDQMSKKLTSKELIRKGHYLIRWEQHASSDPDQICAPHPAVIELKK